MRELVQRSVSWTTTTSREAGFFAVKTRQRRARIGLGRYGIIWAFSATSNFTAYPHDKAASEGSVTGDEVSLRERKRLESRCDAGGMKGGQMTMIDADWN